MAYPLDVGGVDDYPMKVGSMLLTMVDPNPGFEVAYNRWYERDHYYAGCMVGPHQMSGSRWVAPRSLKNLRWPAGDTTVANPTDAGSYVAIYDPVPLELALDKAEYTGMVSLAVQPGPGVDTDAVLAWFDAHLPGFMAGGPVANASAWRSAPLLDTAPSFVPRDPEADARVLLLFHLEADPRTHWDAFRALGAEIDGSGIMRTIWCGPFIPTVIGTDTYTDQLW